MRYILCDDIVFNDHNRGAVTIKDTRAILTEEVKFEVEKKYDELLDEIAVKQEVFGEGGEIQTYRLFDLNILKIVENNFDLTKLRKIKVPK